MINKINTISFGLAQEQYSYFKKENINDVPKKCTSRVITHDIRSYKADFSEATFLPKYRLILNLLHLGTISDEDIIEASAIIAKLEKMEEGAYSVGNFKLYCEANRARRILEEAIKKYFAKLTAQKTDEHTINRYNEEIKIKPGENIQIIEPKIINKEKNDLSSKYPEYFEKVDPVTGKRYLIPIK